MNTKTKAQIYLADQRGCSETNDFRSYHTFNFGAYTDESRQPFGALCLLNDDMIRAGASLSMQVDAPTVVFLLPVAGGLAYTFDQSGGASTVDFLEPGQVGILSLERGSHFSVSNPYETETINFLQLWLTHTSGIFLPAVNQTGFDLTTKNTLLPLLDQPDSRLFIGQYSGRNEGKYLSTSTLWAKIRGIYVFVLQGTFEVANRLLHKKDGLAIQIEQGSVLEFESLSNDATLLLIDLATSA